MSPDRPEMASQDAPGGTISEAVDPQYGANPGSSLTVGAWQTSRSIVFEGLRMLALADRIYSDPVVLTDWRGNVIERPAAMQAGKTITVRKPQRYQYPGGPSWND